jgi:hypothetical protein
MGFVHMSVNSTSRVYLQNERRYNYTTPKSFLEQISLYSKLLRQKSSELTGKVARLENGLDKLRSTAEQVKCNHLIFSGIMCKIQLLYFLICFFVPNNFETNGSFQAHHISFTNIMQLMTFGARVTTYSDDQTNPTCKLCDKMFYCLNLTEVLHIVTTACTVVIFTFTLTTCDILMKIVFYPSPYKGKENLSRSPCVCVHMPVTTGQTCCIVRWQQH